MSVRKYIKKHALNKFFGKECIKDLIVHFCPAVSSDNVGDAIIADAVSKELCDLFPEANIVPFPCKTPLHLPGVYHCNTANFRFVGGTNILRGNKPQRTWAVDWSRIWRYERSILMGAGWGKYQKTLSLSSRLFYRLLLDRKFMHSVRDSYTLEQLKRCGFSNVINTGCPTTWRLTEKFCSGISTEKRSSAVLTLTDYAKDPERDRCLIRCCAEHYKNLFFFSQSQGDKPYFYSIVPEDLADKFRLIPPQLGAYDRFLEQEQPDFIGTRLHGGIRAIQHRCRALIIGIDNRAKEMGKDLSLPFIPQEKITEDLPGVLKEGWRVALKIPAGNIEIWKSQFVNREGHA